MIPVKNSELTPALQAWAVRILKMGEPLGTERRFSCDGKSYVARIEQHTYYGADLSKLHTPHRGVTLYHAAPEIVTLPEVTIYGTPPGSRTLLAVPGIERTTHEFRVELCEMCDRLDCDPDHMVVCFSFETGGTFDPAQRNAAGSSGTGLIQFMAATAAQLGTTTAALARMTAVEQLKFVERYFRPYRAALGTLEGVYLSIFYPRARSMKPADVVARVGSKTYEQNKGLDRDKDGDIEVQEICKTIRAVEARAGGKRVPV